MRENIFTGFDANDGTGDTLRVAFKKTNNNFATLYSNTNYLTSDYALALTDAGDTLYITAGVNGTKVYLPDTGSVPFDDSTIIRIISHTSAYGNVTIIPNASVSLYKSGNNVSASRNVTTYGVATLHNPTSNVWYITGDTVV